jgi:hypothetical protein
LAIFPNFKPILRLDFRKLDDLRGKIFGNLSLVKLAGYNYKLAQFGRYNAQMGIVFARYVNSEDIIVTDTNIVRFLELEL